MTPILLEVINSTLIPLGTIVEAIDDHHDYWNIRVPSNLSPHLNGDYYKYRFREIVKNEPLSLAEEAVDVDNEESEFLT